MKFENAQEMAKNHPKTFEAPNQKELSRIKKHWWVKVCVANSERFWVLVKKVRGNQISGNVDNDLVCTENHGLKYGDEIFLRKENVYQIQEGA